MIRRLLRSDAVAGLLVGAALFAGMFVLALILSPGFSYMNSTNEKVAEIVSTVFRPLGIRYHVRILAVALGIGAVVGVGAGVLGGAVARRLHPRRGGLRWAWYAGFAALAQVLVTADGLIRYPQLYSDWFHGRGGFPRALQAFLTDHVPLAVPDLALLALAGAAVAVALVRLEQALPRRWRISVPAAAGLAAVAWSLSPSGDRVPAVPALPDRPNVLIVGIDSLRPDAVDEQTAPNLAALAREGALLDNAIVPLARTFPSWVSTLTSTPPNVHGVRNMFPRHEHRDLKVPALPRILGGRGWRTGVIADYAGDIFPRIDLGFDEVRAPRFVFDTLVEQRSLERQFLLLPWLTNRLGRAVFPVLTEFAQNADPQYVADDFRDWLAGGDADRPFFATVFLSTAHFPYAAPYPFYNRFVDPDYEGPYKYYKPPMDHGSPTPADEAQVRALYRGAVHAADRAVGRMLDILRDAGALDRTLVIVLADHGEALYDGGRRTMGHGDNLSGRQSYTIPLIVRAPWLNAAPVRNGSVVRSLDVAPTVLDLAGLPPEPGFLGTSLRPLLEGRERSLGLTAFAETGLWFVRMPTDPYADVRVEYPELDELLEIDFDRGNEVVIKEDYAEITNLAKYRMVQDDRWKVVYVPTRDGRVRWELFDLVADPDETTNLADRGGEALEAAKKELFRWMMLEKGVFLRNELLIPE